MGTLAGCHRTAQLQLTASGGILLCGLQRLLVALEQPEAAVLVYTAMAFSIVLRTQHATLVRAAVTTVHCCWLAAALHTAG